MQMPELISAAELLGGHTRGPWKLDEARSSLVYLVNDRSGNAVGEVSFADFRRPADALLVAAAPQLLTAAVAALKLLKDPDAEGPDADRVEALLEEAVGLAREMREVRHA